MMIETKYFWDVFWFEYHDFGPLLMNGWYKSGFGGLDINNVCELRPFNNRLQRNPNHLCKAAKVSPAQKTTPFNLKGVFVGPHLQFVKKNTTFDFLDFPTQSHLFRDSPNILTILLCLIPFLWWIFSLIPQIHREIHLGNFCRGKWCEFPALRSPRSSPPRTTPHGTPSPVAVELATSYLRVETLGDGPYGEDGVWKAWD